MYMTQQSYVWIYDSNKQDQHGFTTDSDKQFPLQFTVYME